MCVPGQPEAASTNAKLKVELAKQRWYYEIFEASSDGIFLSNVNTGKFTEINRAGCTMFGYGRHELIGCDIRELSTGTEPYTREAAFRWFAKAQSEPQLFEWHCKAKDGHFFWVEISLRCIIFGDDKIGLALLRDITRRIELEKTLEANITISAQLATMAQRLQSCRSREEIADAVTRYGPQILPGVPGGLYAFRNSRNLLSVVTSWNEPVGLIADLSPGECWAFRRGQVHTVKDTGREVVCQHVNLGKLKGYSCRPLVAQGEILGLLYLEVAPGKTEAEPNNTEGSSYVDLFSENISLALGNQYLNEKLRDQSIRDPLTGLFNRRYFEEALEIDLARAARCGSAASLIMGDIDLFKTFNDRFGHHAGDFVLKQVAETMQSNVRSGDVVCRYGGEELLVLLSDADLLSARENAERIRQAIKSLTLTFRGRALDPVTISFGIATFPAQAQEGQALISAADAAMYEAKRAGRDRIEVASVPTTMARPTP